MNKLFSFIYFLYTGVICLTVTAMALGMGLIAVYAILMGKHHSPVSSVFEIMGLNGFFVVLFLQSARLFSRDQ